MSGTAQHPDLPRPSIEAALRDDPVVWLSSVQPDGRPHLVPVWFHWDGGEHVAMYSQPGARVRNIEANPHVTLNFGGDGRGGDIVVLTGEARIAEDEPPAEQVAPCVAKYTDGFARIGMTAAQFAQTYSVAVRVTPTKVRGH